MTEETKSIILKEEYYIEGETLEIKKRIGNRYNVICDGRVIIRTRSEILINYWQDWGKKESYFNYKIFKKWKHRPDILCIDILNMEVFITGAIVRLDNILNMEVFITGAIVRLDNNSQIRIEKPAKKEV